MARTDRTLRVDGLVNARDLGGLTRTDGTATPRGVFFRSENVDQVTPEGWEQLRASGVRTIVDLRQPSERARDGNARPDWVTSIQVDLDGLENTEFWNGYLDNGLVGTALYFLPHLEAMPERAGAVLSAIVTAPEGGVLFHCMGGRDRTGLIALLLLRAADADPEDIVDDYLQTVRLGDVRAASSSRKNVEWEIEELCRAHGTTTEGAFRSVVEQLDLESVLDASGLGNAERAALSSWRGALEGLP